MFTGLVEESGVIDSITPRAAGARLTVRCEKVLEDSREGSSIAVNGVCLTAVDLRPRSFAADVAPETLQRSNLGDLAAGSVVNLERPLSAGGRLGGHIMQGHVDGTGEFLSMEEIGDGNWWLSIRAPAELDQYLVFKGSIAIDGISLTVAAIEGEIVSATVVPHTYRNTTLRGYQTGARLNLECDIIAKYVAKLLGKLERPSPLSVGKLKEMGY